jgi:hypothetical protein
VPEGDTTYALRQDFALFDRDRCAVNVKVGFAGVA